MTNRLLPESRIVPAQSRMAPGLGRATVWTSWVVLGVAFCIGFLQLGAGGRAVIPKWAPPIAIGLAFAILYIGIFIDWKAKRGKPKD